MKTILVALVSVASAVAQTYQPPTLSNVEAPARSGALFNVFVTYGRGSISANPNVTLHYSGTQAFARTAFSSSSTTAVSISFPAPLSGSYRLDAIELSDGGGNTRFNRDGTIVRSLYAPGALPTTHAIQLSTGDFSVGTATPQVFETGRATNLSTRGFVGTGSDVMIVGIVVSSGSRSFLFRGVGPALSAFGVSGALRATRLELRNQSGAIVASTESVSADAAAAAQTVGAFALSPSSRDAALKTTLAAGNYTLVVSGADGSSGVALAEAYELQ